MTADDADQVIENFGDTRFKVVPLDACLGLAQRLQATSRVWHSHVLIPGCVENPYPDYAIVIEDPDAGDAFIARSELFPEVDKTLVRMLHGDDILDSSMINATGAQRADAAVLRRARDAHDRGLEWHHHMCFPGCLLSRDRGSWTILLECDGQVTWDAWETEPVHILRELEVLCFG